jgi:hypothetical protein
MKDEFIIQQLKEAMAERHGRPAHEQFQDMVRRGLIDQQGRVLKRMPEPPDLSEPKPSDAASANGTLPRQDVILEQLKEAIRENGNLSVQEWYQDLVRRGLIDEQGRLLTQTAEPSAAGKKKESRQASK